MMVIIITIIIIIIIIIIIKGGGQFLGDSGHSWYCTNIFLLFIVVVCLFLMQGFFSESVFWITKTQSQLQNVNYVCASTGSLEIRSPTA